MNSDQPIESIKDDLLGRGEYCIALANAISNWRGQESLVIAINGPWGSGKSSIKNIVLQLLAKAEKPVSVVEFNPWQLSGTNHIAAVFLKEVGLAAGNNSKDSKAISEKFERYANLLTFGGTAIKYMGKAGEVLGIPFVSGIASLVQEGSKESSEVLSDAAKTSSSAEQSLTATKHDLAKVLRSRETPILVIVDDIDRLMKDEISLLFRLIRSNADFPNMTFLLLFDRDIVQNALNDVSGLNGRDYLEKIIQVNLELPEVLQDKLDAIFHSGLREAFLRCGISSDRIDKDRWDLVFKKGLQPFIETIRDARRLLSSLAFSISLFIRKERLEVNAIDLIGIETIRVFEPKVYRGIVDNLELFVSKGWDEFLQDRKPEEKKKQFEAIVKLASNQVAVNDLLVQLFPSFAGFSDDRNQWEKDLRICSTRIFPRYFIYNLPDGEMTLAEIEDVVLAFGDEARLQQKFEQLRAEMKVEQIIERLKNNPPKVGAQEAENVGVLLFDIGDELSKRTLEWFGFEFRRSATWLLHALLRPIKDKTEKSKLVLRAIERSFGLMLPLDLVSTEERLLEKNDRSLRSPMLQREELPAAKQILGDRIAVAAANGQLERSGLNLGFYLSAWIHLCGRKEDASKFVSALGESLNGTLVLLRGIAGISRSSGGDSFHFRLEDVKTFLPIEQIESTLSMLKNDGSESVAAEFKGVIAGFMAALARRDKGLPDDSSINPLLENQE